MNEIEDLLERMKEEADWLRIEHGHGYAANIIEEAMEEIKRLHALNERIKLYMLEKAVEMVEEMVAPWSIAASEDCVAALRTRLETPDA